MDQLSSMGSQRPERYCWTTCSISRMRPRLSRFSVIWMQACPVAGSKAAWTHPAGRGARRRARSERALGVPFRPRIGLDRDRPEFVNADHTRGERGSSVRLNHGPHFSKAWAGNRTLRKPGLLAFPAQAFVVEPRPDRRVRQVHVRQAHVRRCVPSRSRTARCRRSRVHSVKAQRKRVPERLRLLEGQGNERGAHRLAACGGGGRRTDDRQAPPDRRH
jgi:hypothetical protein